MRGFAGSAALLVLALLTGCASLPDAPAADPAASNTAWALHQQQLAGVRGFQLNGRVAVKGGGLSGALRWQQDGEHYTLRIAGPFGAGALLMEGTPELVHIKGKDVDLVTAEPEQVLAERTGWRLPLNALRWWVLGLPAPQTEGEPAANILLDAQGHALQMRQDGWTLRYSDYRADALPYRIEATQPTSDGEWMATVILEAITLAP